MKRVALVLSLLLLATSAKAFGQCDILEAKSQPEISMTICQEIPTPKKGDTALIEAGGGQIVTTVTFAQKITAGDLAGQTQVTAAIITEPVKAQEDLLLLLGIKTATVKFGTKSVELTVLPGRNALNTSRYEWSIGPATQGNKNTNTASTSTTPAPTVDNALRFRYTGEYARGGIFGQQFQEAKPDEAKPDDKKKPLFQTTASLSIDTTDQSSPDFIDNNRVSVGTRLTNLSFGRLLMHGNLGIEARLDKAFHQDVRDVDAVVTASGWVPVIRSLTLFSQSDFIAAPLSFNASYGYRDRSQAGESVKGRVFEGSALYNLFLFDKFQVSFSATLTNNDLDNQPAGTPKTQRLYKGTIAYLENTTTGFKVLTSIEDGSAGVMLRKVRQYFIGIALSKIDLSSTGGS